MCYFYQKIIVIVIIGIVVITPLTKVMETNNIHNLIDSMAKSEGFASWGYISNNNSILHLNNCTEQYLESMNHGDFADMSYMKERLNIRRNPALLLNNISNDNTANSSNHNVPRNVYIIVFLASYHNSENSTVSKFGDFKIAQYAIGKDYHIVIKQKLQNILSAIKKEYPPVEGRVFTDSAPILERSLANICGLGSIGKNGFLISKTAGIKTFIGSIIIGGDININIPDKSPTQMFSLCGKCRKCLDSCPTGALYAPGKINANYCISYHTIENRKEYFPFSLPNPDKYFYGCDICLDVCPWNGKNVQGMSELTEMLPSIRNLLENPIEYLKGISSSKFNRIFSDSPIKRAGRDKILNTLEVLENYNNIK